MPRAKKRLEPQDVTIIVDTREQKPFDFSKVSKDHPKIASRKGTLKTGDYSIAGYADQIAIERKSLSDLLSCIGASRPRFEMQLARLRSYRYRCVVVEATWYALMIGDWQNKLSPRQVMGSVTGWMADGIPFFFANRPECINFTANFLWIAARRCHYGYGYTANDDSDAGLKPTSGAKPELLFTLDASDFS